MPIKSVKGINVQSKAGDMQTILKVGSGVYHFAINQYTK